MTTEADFLAAICAEPHDDTHRLVFADWLEERGETGDAERAEFIRVQCEIARALADNKLVSPGGPEDLWLRAAKKKERQLLARLRPAFAASLPAYLTLHWRIYRRDADDGTAEEFTAAVSRGFVSLVTVSCQAWQDHGPALVAGHPVEVVRLVDVNAVASSATPGVFCSQHPDPYYWPWMREEYGGNDDHRRGFKAATKAEIETLVGRAALAWAREKAKLPPLRTP